MPLTKCKECGLMVSSEAKTCPHCGVKLKRFSWWTLWVIISCISLLALLHSLRHSVKEYSGVKKNADKTRAKQEQISGDIIANQVIRENKATDARTDISEEIEAWIKTDAEKYAKESFADIEVVYKNIFVEKKPSSEDYKATVTVDAHNLKDKILILEIERSADGYIYKWSQEARDFLQGEIIKKQIKTDAEVFAKESFKGTHIVYKKIGGIRKESLSKDDYTVVVEVDTPDQNDMVFILEIKDFEDTYTIGWDARSATSLALLKAGEKLEQITR